MLKYGVERIRIAIIGGGASGVCLAGFLSDIASKKTGVFDIHLFESSDQLLRKVAATGNGRCNFTNTNMDKSHYTGGSSSFVKDILDGFTFHDAMRLFQSLGIAWTTLASGMTYPATMQASTVVERLKDWLEAGSVKVHYHSEIVSVEEASDEDGHTRFNLQTKDKSEEAFDILVLASGGGYGIGKNEVSDGYALAKRLGHDLTPMHPGIVALKVEEVALCQACQGSKVEVAVWQEGRSTVHRDDLLFTSYGLSGIGILKVSNDVLYDLRRGKKASIIVDFLPDKGASELVEEVTVLRERFPGWPLEKIFSGYLPNTLVKALIETRAEFEASFDKSARPSDLKAFITLIKAFPFQVKGQKNKDRGQITCGGIDLDLINPHTLESTVTKNLYFTGEVLDVQGECGGYNLHWAWASAQAVAKAISNTVD